MLDALHLCSPQGLKVGHCTEQLHSLHLQLIALQHCITVIDHDMDIDMRMLSFMKWRTFIIFTYFCWLIATLLHCTKPWGSLRDRLENDPWCLPSVGPSGLRLNGILLSGLVNVKCNYPRIGHVLICLAGAMTPQGAGAWDGLQCNQNITLHCNTHVQGIIIISNWGLCCCFNDDKTFC